jgi:hypothetical protein
MLNLSLSLSLSLCRHFGCMVHCKHFMQHIPVIISILWWKLQPLEFSSLVGTSGKFVTTPMQCAKVPHLSLCLCDEVSKQPPSVCYIGHDALSTKFLFQIGDDGQVACDDIIMPTITPKRPRALPKISITKIFTNRVEFCASDNAQLLPMIPTHSLPKKTIC